MTIKFCTGYGQHDTHALEIRDKKTGRMKKNPHAKRGQDYDQITYDEIRSSVLNPPKVAKNKSQWAIFSDFNAHDARSFAVQKERGTYSILPVDLDVNVPHIDDVKEAISNVFGEDVEFIIYSSRSAKPEEPKFRILFPLQEPVKGSNYAATQRGLFDLLDEQGLTCDRVFEREGQLVYLPNKGQHYEYHINDGQKLCASVGVLHERIQSNAKADEAARANAQLVVKSKPLQPLNVAADDDPRVWFNANHQLADVLQRYGYVRDGNTVNWRSPLQSGGSFATMVIEEQRWVSLSHSDNNAGLGHQKDKDVCFGDAYDIYVHFEHSGNHKEAYRAIRHKMPKPEPIFKPVETPTIQKDTVASRIANVIQDRVQEVCLSTPHGRLCDPVIADTSIIEKIIGQSFFSPAQGKLNFLNPMGELVRFGVTDVARFLSETFGSPVAKADLQKCCDLIAEPNNQHTVMAELQKQVWQPIIDHIRLFRQRDLIAWSVDMFSTEPKFVLREFDAQIILPHKPWEEGEYQQEYINDYIQHWPEFISVLDFITDNRFASDRKKSYLWLQADTDWGKGVFSDCLKTLGIVVTSSMREIETMMSGAPVGLSADNFKRAIVLWVDEFKSVKSELKQLQNEIELSPKNQLRQSVAIYTKLFTSAESVASLVTSHGVEDQFSNRLSLLTGSGSIENRRLFLKDKGAYFTNLKHFCAYYLNKKVVEYQLLGRTGATRQADQKVWQFHHENGIGEKLGRVSDNLKIIAQNFRDSLHETPDVALDIVKLADGSTGLKRPRKYLENWLKLEFDDSERTTFGRKAADILKYACLRNKGITAYRTKAGTTAKVIVIGWGDI